MVSFLSDSSILCWHCMCRYGCSTLLACHLPYLHPPASLASCVCESVKAWCCVQHASPGAPCNHCASAPPAAAGINVRKGATTDMLEENVVQPLLVSGGLHALHLL